MLLISYAFLKDTLNKTMNGKNGVERIAKHGKEKNLIST